MDEKIKQEVQGPAHRRRGGLRILPAEQEEVDQFEIRQQRDRGRRMSSTTSNASTMSMATASTAIILGVSTNPHYIQNCFEPQAPKLHFTGFDFGVFECIWLVFCGSGGWSIRQPLRIVALLIGFIKAMAEIIVGERMRITLSWFLVYLLGCIKLDTPRIGAAKSMALLMWLLLDIAVDIIGGTWDAGYLLEGVSMAFFLWFHLTLTLLKYGRPGVCQPDRIVGSIAWAAGWVVLAVCDVREQKHQFAWQDGSCCILSSTTESKPRGPEEPHSYSEGLAG